MALIKKRIGSLFGSIATFIICVVGIGICMIPFFKDRCDLPFTFARREVLSSITLEEQKLQHELDASERARREESLVSM